MAAVACVAAAGTAHGATRGLQSAATGGAGDSALLNLDFESGVWPGSWHGLDAWAPGPGSTIDLQQGNGNRNFHLVRDPVLRSWGRFAGAFQMLPTDGLAGNGRYAVLLNGGNNGDRPGNDFWYALAFYFPSSVQLNGETIWDIHDPWYGFNVLPGGVPIVLGVERSEILGLPGPSHLLFTTTMYVGNGTPGGKPVGWSPRVFVLGQLVHDRWIKFLVHLKFVEGSGGRYQVWVDSTSDQRRARFLHAALAYKGPTVKWTSVPVDAAGRVVPPLHDLANYQLLGIYRWAAAPGSLQLIYSMGVRRRASRAAAVAAFGR